MPGRAAERVPQGTSGEHRWLERAENGAFALSLGVALGWVLVSLTWPFGWDQGIFAWIGDSIVRGGVPYRDAWDIKGPLVYFVYAIAQWLFGREAWAIRLLEVPILATGALALGSVTTRLTSARIGRWTGLLFVFYFASNRYWHTAQPDAWVGILALLGLYSTFRGNASIISRRSLALAAGTIGLCALVKPIYAALLITLLPGALTRREGSEGRVGARMGAVAFGFLTPLAIAAGWFLSRGALGTFVDTYLRYPVEVYAGDSAQPLATRVRDFKRSVLNESVTLACAPLGLLGLAVLWRRSRENALVLSSWLLVGLGLICLQGRFWSYHWVTIYPPVFLAVALGIHGLAAESEADSSPVGSPSLGNAGLFAILIAGGLVLNGVQLPATDLARLIRLKTGRMTERAYSEFYGQSRYEREAAAFLRENTSEGDHVAIWGWNSGVLFYAGRQSASRFGFSMPLLMGGRSARRDAYRAEFLEALHDEAPPFVVISPDRLSTLDVSGDGSTDLDEFPEFRDHLAARYRRVREFGDLIVYQRGAEDPPR